MKYVSTASAQSYLCIYLLSSKWRTKENKTQEEKSNSQAHKNYVQTETDKALKIMSLIWKLFNKLH